jgi:hypothetical protein
VSRGWDTRSAIRPGLSPYREKLTNMCASCLQIFLYTNELAERGVHKLEKKNVVFTKEGAKVGVKEVSAETYADKTQKAFVNTWNAAQDGYVFGLLLYTMSKANMRQSIISPVADEIALLCRRTSDARVRTSGVDSADTTYHNIIIALATFPTMSKQSSISCPLRDAYGLVFGRENMI